MDLAVLALCTTAGVALVLGLGWVLADGWQQVVGRRHVVLGAPAALGDDSVWGAGVDIDVEWAAVAETWSRG